MRIVVKDVERMWENFDWTCSLTEILDLRGVKNNAVKGLGWPVVGAEGLYDVNE